MFTLQQCTPFFLSPGTFKEHRTRTFIVSGRLSIRTVDTILLILNANFLQGIEHLLSVLQEPLQLPRNYFKNLDVYFKPQDYVSELFLSLSPFHAMTSLLLFYNTFSSYQERLKQH